MEICGLFLTLTVTLAATFFVIDTQTDILRKKLSCAKDIPKHGNLPNTYKRKILQKIFFLLFIQKKTKLKISTLNVR